MKKYIESGNGSLLRVYLALGCAFLLSIVLGFLYSAFTWVMPIIYLNIIATLASVGLLTISTLLIFYLLKIRNQKQITLISISASLFLWFFGWVGFITFALEESVDVASYFGFFGGGYSFPGMFEVAGFIYEEGIYEIMGVVVRGTFALVIWGLELTIFMVLPLIIQMRISVIPFSEKQNRWYRKRIVDQQFMKVVGGKVFLSELFKDPVGVLKSQGLGDPLRYSQIIIYYLEGEEHQYASVLNVVVDRQDSKKVDKDLIIQNMEIKTSDAEEILKFFGYKEKTNPFIFTSKRQDWTLSEI